MTHPFAAPATPAVDPSMAGAIRDVEKQFAIMIVKTRKSILNRAAAVHPELQPTGYKILTILSQSGPLQQGLLAHGLDTDKAAMSRTLKHMEQIGLVVRTPDPSDGRAHLVAMTPLARTRFDETQREARQLLYDRLEAWDVAEVNRFAELLDRLNASED